MAVELAAIKVRDDQAQKDELASLKELLQPDALEMQAQSASSSLKLRPW